MHSRPRRRLDTAGVDAGLILSLSAMIHLAKGDVAAGLAAVEAQAPTTEPTHPMVLGGVRVMGGRFDEARPFLAQANEMAASRPDYFVAAVAPTFEAVAELEGGRVEAARDLAISSIEFADEHRIGEAPQMALAHSVLARTTERSRHGDASALRGVQLARRSPENVMLTYALASAADVAFDQGHPDAEALVVRSPCDRRSMRRPGDRRALPRQGRGPTRSRRPAARRWPRRRAHRPRAVGLAVSPVAAVATRDRERALRVAQHGEDTLQGDLPKARRRGPQAAIQTARDHGLL